MRELHLRKMPMRERRRGDECWFRCWLKEERRTWAFLLLAATAVALLKFWFEG